MWKETLFSPNNERICLRTLIAGIKFPCSVIRILNRKPRLVVPGKTIFPFSSLGPIKHKRFLI